MKVLYVVSDPLTSPKGASVRISATIEALRSRGDDVEVFQPSVAAGPEADFLGRMLALRREVASWLSGRRGDLIQFRGIWEGVPAVHWARARGVRSVYEAHGFPSVELEYHYPGLHRRRTLEKIILEERALLSAVDRVITPSRTGRRFLLMRGVPAERVDVIPNGVDVNLFSPAIRPAPDAPPYRLVYVGTLSPWQGLATLVEALHHLRNGPLTELFVIGPTKGVWRRQLLRVARRLKVEPALRLSGPATQPDLVPALRSAHVCLAPLPDDSRNSLQGCCPIKILEYMAAGRPIVASRIAPVEEILEHRSSAYLVRAGSALELARGIRFLLENPAEREALGLQARARAVAEWTVERFRERVAGFMESLAGRPAGPVL
ncbi:MAG: glycosyltransferase family 4 protein [Candidatus Riflebacteria bacterium]|nr:glycosyltransferase family 4 protein [Candidatus Riflebacteria bacterium]